jgi:Cu(I)/Ag(I) efflux system membrane protein CusA/SilA
VTEASVEVGPALFFSLSRFHFCRSSRSKRRKGDCLHLCFTKTYAMAASAGLAVTLVPVLMGYLIRGRIPAETRNPLNRWLMAIYELC